MMPNPCHWDKPFYPCATHAGSAPDAELRFQHYRFIHAINNKLLQFLYMDLVQCAGRAQYHSYHVGFARLDADTAYLYGNAGQNNLATGYLLQ